MNVLRVSIVQSAETRMTKAIGPARAPVPAGVVTTVAPTVVLAADEPAAIATSAAAPDNAFTASVALHSEYLFRGLTQTNRRPTLQGGFDYAHSSGFYAGVWASNISWISDAAPGVSASPESGFYSATKAVSQTDQFTLMLQAGKQKYKGENNGSAMILYLPTTTARSNLPAPLAPTGARAPVAPMPTPRTQATWFQLRAETSVTASGTCSSSGRLDCLVKRTFIY